MQMIHVIERRIGRRAPQKAKRKEKGFGKYGGGEIKVGRKERNGNVGCVFAGIWEGRKRRNGKWKRRKKKN